MNIVGFKAEIYEYFYEAGRQFIWREKPTPYYVFISEVMLQQTQTARVSIKFEEFVAIFPTFEMLAMAPFEQVLMAWKGLGYNRRALYLQQAAQRVVSEFGSQLPDDPKILQTFPGIGAATAASIVAFAFNKPTVFIETNIRTVFLYFFLRGKMEVKDSEIFPLVEKTVDTENPRLWYYALTDYGVMLKKKYGSFNSRSAHYTKQSKFEGSDRQLRGKILQVLLEQKESSLNRLVSSLKEKQKRVSTLLIDLIKEGLLDFNSGVYSIAKR